MSRIMKYHIKIYIKEASPLILSLSDLSSASSNKQTNNRQAFMNNTDFLNLRTYYTYLKGFFTMTSNQMYNQHIANAKLQSVSLTHRYGKNKEPCS